MQILIDGDCERAMQLAAQLCLNGHEVVLSAALAGCRAGLDTLTDRLELPLARLSDHALPARGRMEVSEDLKGAAERADLCLQIGSGGGLCAGTGLMLQPELPQPAWLPFCHLPQGTPETAALMEAAGFLLCTPDEILSLNALAASVSGLPQREEALSVLLRALRDQGLGPGGKLLARDQARETVPEAASEGPVRLKVLPSWIDYNGHMTESRYLAVCSEVTDVVLRRAGIDLSYVAGGFSYYTVETHLRHLRESKLGQEILGGTRVLGVDSRRLHLLTTLWVEGQEVATLEQMLVHVDMAAGRATAASEAALAPLRAMAAARAAEPLPEWLGRGIRRIAAAQR